MCIRDRCTLGGGLAKPAKPNESGEPSGHGPEAVKGWRPPPISAPSLGGAAPRPGPCGAPPRLGPCGWVSPTFGRLPPLEGSVRPGMFGHHAAAC
eukprot:13415460-Alexandrium_andersonii.AAC.1